MKTEKKKGVLRRLFKTVLSFYPVLLPVAIACITLTAIVGAVPAIFMQRVIENITAAIKSNTPWSEAGGPILNDVYILIALYVTSLASGTAFGQLMTIITQGTLEKLRDKMFNGMQRLPVKFFDTTGHGDIMSYYTNDIDTLRQLISQSAPQILISGITVLSVLFIMLYYCLWLTLVVLAGTAVMLIVTKKIGGGSARYFVKQQQAIGEEEGYIEEMLVGQEMENISSQEGAEKRPVDENTQNIAESVAALSSEEEETEHLEDRVKLLSPGAVVAKRDYGIDDEEVLSAIEYHTTGKEVMSDIEKLIFCSDMLEENRDFDGVNKLRKSIEKSLDEGYRDCVLHQYEYLYNRGGYIYPLTIDAVRGVKGL